ncbi:YndJ family protein [Sediminibacillus massiliensis]|uniref:YndJ family protein n=1 Tax=Sediminibacillus massiliensis TaxID=1926277 RepID=UPI0015C37A25|nr:YndJ family protein [Sediminibacillus massiliensis]
MTFRKIGMMNIGLFTWILLFGEHAWHFLLLTAAQLIYVPFVLDLIMKENSKASRYLSFLSVPAMLAVFFLQITETTILDSVLAATYFLFTLLIAGLGIYRFTQRGFVHVEEAMIDIGLVYIMIGGGWFLAFETNIETGFSSIMTWLTAIHFHYAAFLLPVFTGFMGRLVKPRLYPVFCMLVAVTPIIVALGITYSVWIELLSVILYIIAIVWTITVAFQMQAPHKMHLILTRLSFLSLGFTILFSLAYAFGNLSGLYSITITFMLKFHGIVNAVLFALAGVIGWSLFLPQSRYKPKCFPVTNITGGLVIGEKILPEIKDEQGLHKGLVNDMRVFEPGIDTAKLSPMIRAFYEETDQFRLFAEVRWHTWFKPFSAVYRLISRKTNQINLPLSRNRVEMTGDILSIRSDRDGREGTRAWVRKVRDDVVFVALYAIHQTNGRTYMNIGLPLPWSAMIGILELHQMGSSLKLTSKRIAPNADSGIYLTRKKALFKLPIDEQFVVNEKGDTGLSAVHKMWIFGLPFLTIHYTIHSQ